METKFQKQKLVSYLKSLVIKFQIHLSSTAPSSRGSGGGGLKRDPSRGYYDVRNSHLIM